MASSSSSSSGASENVLSPWESEAERTNWLALAVDRELDAFHEAGRNVMKVQTVSALRNACLTSRRSWESIWNSTLEFGDDFLSHIVPRFVVSSEYALNGAKHVIKSLEGQPENLRQAQKYRSSIDRRKHYALLLSYKDHEAVLVRQSEDHVSNNKRFPDIQGSKERLFPNLPTPAPDLLDWAITDGQILMLAASLWRLRLGLGLLFDELLNEVGDTASSMREHANFSERVHDHVSWIILRADQFAVAGAEDRIGPLFENAQTILETLGVKVSVKLEALAKAHDGRERNEENSELEETAKLAIEESQRFAFELWKATTRQLEFVRPHVPEKLRTYICGPISQVVGVGWQLFSERVDCWTRAQTTKVELQIRADALIDCVEQDGEKTADYIINELGRSDIDQDWAWRDTLVRTALRPEVQPGDRKKELQDSLLRIARSIRDDDFAFREGQEHVVWAAMRRYASLATVDDAPTLAQFLDNVGTVDARLVALECVARMLAREVPKKESMPALRDRVAGFATKYLDQDVFEGGEKSAIALAAVQALAALGDPRLKEAVGLAGNLCRQWLSLQIKEKLESTLQGWKATGADERGGEEYQAAHDLIASCLKLVDKDAE